MGESLPNFQPAQDPMLARLLPNGRSLAPHHAELIKASAISDAVRDARGYYTATTRRELRDLGYSERQQGVIREASRSLKPLAMALVIPIRDVTGEIVLHQIRPDEPYSNGEGRPVRYLIPPKAHMGLDVPPTIRHLIGNPSLPLLITEGIRKADSAASAGLCCIALLGVSAWRGTNDAGGKVALAAFESIALNGRATYIVFDSDVITKHDVHEAMKRLKAFLESRGAVVSIIYLPTGEHGEKTGLDDYLAAGHTRDELFALATDQLREPERLDVHVGPRWEAGPYAMTAAGIVYDKPTQGGTTHQQLTDFAALIKRKVIEDDGVEQRQRYELVVQQGDRREEMISVLATEFESMRWTRRVHHLDPYVAAGIAVRDHARAAIDLMSQKQSERAYVFTHVGWRRLAGGEWGYLHTGGAIGPAGSVAGVTVELSSELARLRLPDPPTGEAERQAVRASLELLQVACDRIMVPLIAAAYRAPLGYMDNSVYLAGATGLFKSETTALVQQHFGPELSREHLPGSWLSTSNALRAQLFLAKDAVLVVDDYVPGSGRFERETWERKAAEVLRAQGNAAARGRADTSGGLRPGKPPRGLLVTSGEDLPTKSSLRARSVIVDVYPGDVHVAQLAAAQRAGAAGDFALSMAGYLRWLAPQLDAISSNLRAETDRFRDQILAAHPRTRTGIAQLAMGWRYFLSYAAAIGAISQPEQAQMWARGWDAFRELAAAQKKHQDDVEPTIRFFELLSGALASGRAHVADRNGRPPDNPAALGWRVTPYEREWIPQGDRVGWLDGDGLYLEPVASYKAAEAMAVEGVGVGIGQKTLGQRLKEKGLLVTIGKDRPATKLRMEGTPKSVLHFRADILETFAPEESGTSGTDAHEAPSSTDREHREQPASQNGHESAGAPAQALARPIPPPVPTDIAADEEASQDDEEDGWEPLE